MHRSMTGVITWPLNCLGHAKREPTGARLVPTEDPFDVNAVGLQPSAFSDSR
jgi:hypothetical protein